MKRTTTLTSFFLTLGLGAIAALALLWLLGGVQLPTVRAVTLTVTNTADSGAGSLRQAIANANDSDMIVFDLSTDPATITLASELSVNKSITIAGPGAGSLFISGNGITRAFNISGGQVTLQDLTVTRGSAMNGGGLYVDGSSTAVTLINVDVVSNTADNGGGVYVHSGSAMLSGGQILGNSVTGNWPDGAGGGVFVCTSTAVFTQTAGTIGGNVASDGGGGVYVASGRATLSGGQILSNTASYWGGGVFVGYGRAVLSGGRILSNTATLNGGGVFVGYGSVVLSGGQILSNTAGSGGGVFVMDDSAVFTQTAGTVGANTTTLLGGDGGGVYIGHGSAVLSGGQVLFNTASHYGGGVYVHSGSATLSGGQVLFNTASHNGGGVYVYSGSATLSGGQILSNTANNGSALYLSGSSAAITTTTAYTLAGDVHQEDGTFNGSANDLCIEGALVLRGGTFHAPPEFDLTGIFSHTGGTYSQMQDVNGSADVGFPKAGGAILNATGQDLGSTQVVIQAGQACAGGVLTDTVARCYAITPTNSSGVGATITFYYHSDELSSGSCVQLGAYRWDGAAWQELALDASYGTGGRACVADPHSLRVQSVDAFGSFVLAFSDKQTSYIYLPVVERNRQ